GNREAGDFVPPSPPEDNSLTYKDFMCYMRDNVLTVHPRYHMALLLLGTSYLSSQITAPFENFKWDKTTHAPPQQLTFGEAYDKLFPVIADITKFICCWLFTHALIWIINTGILPMFCTFLCFAAPYFFFSELARMTTKTGVSCGPVKLPAFWFTVLVAVGISSMFVLATLVMSYTRWRLSNGKPRVGEVDDAILEELPEVLQG
ncbi:hypothetical protein A2U01_0020541, partial [Trifolium medium]|nr:hypothetical protein [Trifolium medium]